VSVLYLDSRKAEHTGINNAIYAMVDLNSIHMKLYINKAGARPKHTMSLKLSNCLPKSVDVFKNLAIEPSMPSSKKHVKIRYADSSNCKLKLLIIDSPPIARLVNVIRFAMFFFI